MNFNVADFIIRALDPLRSNLLYGRHIYRVVIANTILCCSICEKKIHFSSKS